MLTFMYFFFFKRQNGSALTLCFLLRTRPALNCLNPKSNNYFNFDLVHLWLFGATTQVTGAKRRKLARGGNYRNKTLLAVFTARLCAQRRGEQRANLRALRCFRIRHLWVIHNQTHCGCNATWMLHYLRSQHASSQGPIPKRDYTNDISTQTKKILRVHWQYNIFVSIYIMGQTVLLFANNK